MHGTTAGLRTDADSRLTGLQHERPEWRAWLGLLGEVRRALDEATRNPAVVLTGTDDAGAPRSAEAPLLQGRTLELDARRLERLMHRLIETATQAGVGGTASLGEYRPGRSEAVRLIAAAVRQDQRDIAEIASQAGLNSAALASVVHLASLPVLHACGRLLQSRVSPGWAHGYCPVCAAWPTLAELRGLDRSRRLRCVRCTAEWEVEPLWCIYCGEREHRRLGSLVLEAPGEMHKVETCDSCQGYIKSVATLQAIPPFELLLQDLETVELDIVARERGFGRPEGSGFVLEVRVEG
jgi:FdhE protein